MFVENISVSQAELDSGTTIKSISGTVIIYNKQQSFYRASEISVVNNSGATIHFVPMSDNEYDYWLNTSRCSAYIPLASGATKTITRLIDGVTKIIISGVAGHTSGVIFTVIKEK